MNSPTSKTFRVWAPEVKSMKLHIVSPDEHLDLIKDDHGYFCQHVPSMVAGTKYFLNPDGKGDFPDPRSHYQPDGVHGASEIVSHDFSWTDNDWKGRSLSDLVIYEIHVGTFTPEGTFDAIIPRLRQLLDVGINAIQLMPVSQFPGDRNWGYDGVFPYAVQNSYGGPLGLKRLVNECHIQGMTVILDVVYNHVGPEGNYLREFGPYFTEHYHTPWGEALNFDGEHSDGVRGYVLDNIEHWFVNYHIDGLRLDAVHAIYDSNAVHILAEINARKESLIKRLGRQFFLIAESDLNDPRVIRSSDVNGYGFDAQWLDDFHHAFYTLLDPKGRQRYSDYGRIEQLAKAFNEGFVFTGEYVEFRKRKYGASSAGLNGNKFIVFSQNHDQVGNRVAGERLTVLVDTNRLKVAAGLLLLSPYVPMLFMGEEYGERAPFLYFVSHSDKALIEAVRKGRKEEFAAFNKHHEQEPLDPLAVETFEDSKLRWDTRNTGEQAELLEWHRQLIGIRQHPAMRNCEKSSVLASVVSPGCLAVNRQTSDGRTKLFMVFNFSDQETSITLPFQDNFMIIDSTADSLNLDSRSPQKGKASLPPCSCLVWANEGWKNPRSHQQIASDYVSSPSSSVE
jgi:maltooligosyltrehalose trehalohydrolase